MPGTYLDPGLSRYISLQLPAGDQTIEEARDAITLFAEEVIPRLADPNT